MALGNKRTPRKFIKDRTDGILDSEKITRASASMAGDIFSQDPAYVDGHVTPILYHADLMQEDIDEIRRHITQDRTQTDNNYTTAEKSKLAGIETGADVTDFTNVQQALTSATDIGTPASTDRVLVQDASDSNKMKYASFSEFGGSGGGGGGLTETPLTTISGRWQWSSADDGERVFTGNTAYGWAGYYNFTAEPSTTTLRIYDGRQVVDTTTATEDAYEMPAYGIWCPNNGKKVKAKLSFRIQNAPANSIWGISLWSAPDPSSGTTTTGTDPTLTLRATSPNVTVTTSSVTYWTTTCTTTSNMNDVWVLPLLENRSGALTTTTYLYGQIALFLV